MGEFFKQGGLTQPGSALVDSGGNSAMVGDPNKIRDTLLRTSANFKPFAGGGTTPAQNPLHDYGIGQPSYKQAATAGATPGGANALSPGLNKAGKLVTLLTSGLQGAMAGRAKSEETVAATGGRRSGGAGMGFEAGYTLPWQRQAQQNQLAQQEAQTGALKAQSQLIQTPNGPIPAWLAKTVLPAQIRGQATENAADTAAQSRIGAARIGQKFKAVPGVGLFDTESRQIVPGTANGVTITPEIAQDYQLPQDFIGKPMNVAQLASLERAQNQQTTTVQGAEGPALVNKRTAQTTPLGLGSPALAGVVPAATDPNNPGSLTYVPKTKAAGMTAPGSASVTASKRAAVSEVPTKIGDQKVAFNTAIQHADLLRQAAKALNNGNVKALAGLSNRAQSEFGDPNLTNFDAIANAYNHEVTSVIGKGHITDAEVAKGGSTMPSNANYETIDKVLSSYQALMKSKMNMLNQQKNAATGAGNVIEWHIENGKLVQGPKTK